MIEKFKEVALQIGDRTITGKDCFVSSFTISTNNNLQSMHSLGSRLVDFMPTCPEHKISFELICQDLSFVDKLFNSKDLIKIRDKKVEDCSIEELMFAVREKVKK